MKWKKKAAALVFGALTMLAASAFASVSPEQVALAGIAPGMTLEQARSVGGAVSYSDYKRIVFQNGAVAETDDDWPGVVDEVKIRSGTAATPAGITLGMGVDAITGAYGQPDRIERDWDDTEYTYYSMDGKKMEFKVINGVIVKITCKLRD